MAVNKLNQENLEWGLQLVKKIFIHFIKNNHILSIPPNEIPPRFQQQQSCFVTYTKHQQLRGCIGSIFPTRPLYEEIISNTIQAAVHDPRFAPISICELPDISVELSILSLPLSIKNLDAFTVGEHGIILRQKRRCSVFLPQVAVEQNWTKEETLMHLCLKASLPENSWQEQDATFEVFTAQKISES